MEASKLLRRFSGAAFMKNSISSSGLPTKTYPSGTPSATSYTLMLRGTLLMLLLEKRELLDFEVLKNEKRVFGRAAARRRTVLSKALVWLEKGKATTAT